MKKYTLFLVAFLSMLGINAQDLSSVGVKVNGARVTIQDKEPIGFSISKEGINSEIAYLYENEVHVRIENQTDDMAYFSFNDSYFIVEGSTKAVISDNTIMLDKDKALEDIKIAPKTNAKVRLVCKEYLESGLPIFSNRWSNHRYKKGEGSDKVTLAVVVKKENGEKIKQEFLFTVRGTAELKDLKNKAKQK